MSMKRLRRTHISARDFRKATFFIQAARMEGGFTPQYEACLLMGIVCYSRPFSRNELGVAPADPRLDGVDVAAELGSDFELHERIVLLRNKAVAHSESLFYPFELSDPPMDESDDVDTAGISFVSQSWHVLNEGIDLDAFERMASLLERRCYALAFDLGREVAELPPVGDKAGREV